MLPDSDAALLADYSSNQNQSAFTELVRRRLDGVYSFALRRVGGDGHLAEDVAQQVFIALARQAAGLVNHPDLTGWIYTTTRHHAANAVRGEQRRKIREQKAHTMPDEASSTTIDWNRVAPLLDAAIEQLNGADRSAICLRFFERRAFGEIGVALRVSEDAARMRVERALEKLHAALARRGLASSSTALATVLAGQLTAAPAGFAATVVSGVLASGASAGASAITAGVFTMTKIKIGFAAAVLVSSALVVREVQASRAVEAELQRWETGQSKLAGIQAANQRITASLAASAATLPESSELVGLRQRIALLKARPEGVVDAAMKPVSAYANRGWAEPVAAYETQLWTRVNGKVSEFAKIYGWTTRGKGTVDRFFAALPPEWRATYGSAEKMLATEDVLWPSGGEPTALQILGQISYGDKVVVQAWGRLASGRETNWDMLFERHGDEWRVPFSDERAEQAIAALDPATGKRKRRN